jgi:hypothetical protein
MARRADVSEVAPAHWSLLVWATRPHWGGDDRSLLAAAAGIAVDPPPPWPEDSEREPPATTSMSVDAVCTAVLDVAASPIERTTVRRIVTERILPFDPTGVAEGNKTADTAAPTTPDAVDLAAADLAAAMLWDGLTDDDRQLLPYLRVPARQLEAQALLGLKKSAIDARQQRLEARVQQLIAATPDPELTGEALLRLHDGWAAGHQPRGSP